MCGVRGKRGREGRCVVCEGRGEGRGGVWCVREEGKGGEVCGV